jgi:hypothetical protein
LVATVLAVTGGLALLLPASCRETSLLVDRPIDAGALTDAKVPKDAGREAASDADAGLSCGGVDGWTAVQPFTRTCKIAVAEPSLWPSLRPTVAPCNNGQAKCTELVLERMSDGRPAQFRSYPMESEASGFVLDIADSRVETCRRSLYLQPEGDQLAVHGGVAVDRTEECFAIPVEGNGRNAVTLTQTAGAARGPEVAVRNWDSPSFDLSMAVTPGFPRAFRSGSTLFPYESSPASYDVVDEPTKRLVKSTAPPVVINQFLPDLSVAGELWGTAGYGQFGRSETWRLDGTGAWSALIQRKGAHIFAPRTDGTTIFWVEGSGNDADFYPQPKLEVWTAPFTTSQATLDATKRKLLDVSGYGYANSAAAHAGYYTVNLGTYDLLVIRADGASQKVHLDGGWAVYLPAYVDATQVWFTHGSEPTASGTSFARIALDLWP